MLNIFDNNAIERNNNILRNNFIKYGNLYRAICDQIFENITDMARFKPTTFINLSDISDYLDHKIISNYGCKKVDIGADLVVSPMVLHKENNIAVYLKKAYNLLNQNGVFIGNVFGGQTLHELRNCFEIVESKYNKYSPHILPMIDLKSSGKLMQVAGFENIVINNINIYIKFKNCKNLMKSLKKMGESNCLSLRQKGFYSKIMMQEILDIYDTKRYDIATFEVVYIFGIKR